MLISAVVLRTRSSRLNPAISVAAQLSLSAKEHQRMGGAVAAGDLAFKGAQIGAQVTPELPEVLALNIIIIRQ
ncbi:hypothetical protein [Mesorhizobium sp.]|uniref:hypothetical protein n=1 Tax=Mesorhizobium sp. TaxID=1871066 RepID=UPI000FE579B8|nr:hypothetical protein [Mesorhizobium sp.]RWE98283.1 MAG: hypothetical protein EOS43_18130 [Mesorhizobium sp.]